MAPRLALQTDFYELTMAAGYFAAGKTRDRATFEKGLAFSAGIDHVLVNGTPVVRDGQTVPGVYPGKAVTSRP